MRPALWNVRVLAIVLALAVFATGAVFGQKGGKGKGGGGTSAVAYSIVKLDTRDSNGITLAGQAYDLSNSGLVVGTIHDGELWQAACWLVAEVSGAITSTWVLLDDEGFVDLLTSARGCNDLGEIVGYGGDVQAVYWSGPNGILEPLPGPNDEVVSLAEDINNQGVICGASSSPGGLQAVAWYRVDGQWFQLALPHLGEPELDEDGVPLPDRSNADAISNADPVSGLITIAGSSNGNAALWTAVLDADGNLFVGPAMILDPGGWASGLNDRGVVCGFGHLGPSSGGDGVVWVDAEAAELLAPTFSKFGNPQQVHPNDINDSDLIVGDNFFQAVVWPDKDAAPILLDEFLAKGKNANFDHLNTAYAVNEWNEIVGYGADDGLFLPFLAVPVPK